MRFYDRFGKTIVNLNRLPHWSQEAGTYFVTYRLADSIPRELLLKWKAERDLWMLDHPQPWDADTEMEYHKMFSGEIEMLMDRGYGDCVLRDPKSARCCEVWFQFFAGERYDLHSWVVMPNHVHVLFSMREGFELDVIVGGWKRKSSRMIRELNGGSGALWQKDYFDRMIRNWDHFFMVARYVRNNAKKAKLGEGEYLLWESEMVREMLGGE